MWVRAFFCSVLVVCASAAAALPPLYGDVNGTRQVNATDVQLVINAALGIPLEPDFRPDINNDGIINAVDVQLVINVALGILAGENGADVTARIYTDEDGPGEGAMLRVFWRDYLLTQQTVDASGEARVRVPADGAIISFQASMPNGLGEEYDPATHKAFTNSLRVLEPDPNVEYSLNFMLYRELPFSVQRTTLDELNGTMRVHTSNHTVMVSDIPEELGIVGGSGRTFSPAISPDAFPGEFATRESGEVDMLISGGFASVNLLREGPDGELEPVSELFDEEGEPVYVTLRFRLDRADWPAIQPGTLHRGQPGYFEDPTRIVQPVYFYDEIEGDWRLTDSFGWLEDESGPVPPEYLPMIQQGDYPNELYLVAELRHFSFINLDYPAGCRNQDASECDPNDPENSDGNRACVTGRLVNEDGEPIKGAKVTIRSMPENHQGLFFSNVITAKTDEDGRFGTLSGSPANRVLLVPRTERNLDDDWNDNGQTDRYYFMMTVEKKGLCGNDYFNNNGQGYPTATFPPRDGCSDVGTLEVNIVEAKVKSYYINFVDSVTGDPLFVAEHDGFNNYAEMFLQDPLIDIPSDTYSCACEDTFCSYFGYLNESGQGFARIPIRDPKTEFPFPLNGGMNYRKDRPDFGPGGYEEAEFNFLHRRDKSHYVPGETICSQDLDGAGMTPPVDTSATAHARFEMTIGGVNLIIEHNVPGATGAYIREAPPGETGPNSFIVPAAETGVFMRQFTMQEFEVIANIPQYLVIESVAHPDGEVRGDFEFCAYTYKVPVERRGAPMIEILSPAPDQVFLYDDMVLLEATGESVMQQNIDALDAFVWTRTGDLVVVANTRVTEVPAWQAFGIGEDRVLDVEAYDFYAYRGDASIGGITVLPVEIEIDSIPTTTIATGGTVQLGASVANANNTSITWTSGNPAVASVNSNGLVTGNSPGTVNIVARSDADPNTVDTVSITVQALVPEFTISPSSGTTDTVFAFDGSESKGDIAEFEWDFGDGNTGFGITTNHSYDLPGTYPVTLTLADPDSVRVTSSPTTVSVVSPDDNIPPSAAFTVTPQSGNPPLTVAFDASASTDPDGDIVLYEWDFGDGTMRSGVTIGHVYETPGTYIVTLTVTDDEGATGTATASVRVNAPPVAAFSFTQTPSTGEAPLQVNFNAAASNDPDGQIVLYEWDFGDGSTLSGSDLVAPSHLYENAGVFEASLRVTDDDGATDTYSETISAVGISAVFSIVSSDLSVADGGYRVEVDASASGSFPYEIETYEWQFGEGVFLKNFVTSDEPEHIYIADFSGTLLITLTVTNTNGDSDSTSQTIELDTPEGQFENVTLVNESPGGMLVTNNPANNFQRISISDDGRFVAFRATVAPSGEGFETTGGPWVFIKDMETGELVQVPRVNPDPGQNPVGFPLISGNGNRVAYQGFGGQIYVYDVALDEHFIASAPPGGEEVGDDTSQWPSISADGRFVAFRSAAGNLVGGVSSGVNNIFVTDLQEDEVVHVGLGRDPTITSDGSKVVLRALLNFHFVTDDFVEHLILVDVVDENPVVVSTNASGSPNFEQTLLMETVSTINNGEWVVFTSRSESLAPEVPDNGVFDIYLKNTETGALTQLTESEGGECEAGQQPGGAGAGRLSDDFRWFAYLPNGFEDECGQFGPFFRNLFLEDTDTGDRANAAFDMWDVQGFYFREVVMTPDGRYIAFRFDSRIFRAENPFWEE